MTKINDVLKNGVSPNAVCESVISQLKEMKSFSSMIYEQGILSDDELIEVFEFAIEKQISFYQALIDAGLMNSDEIERIAKELWQDVSADGFSLSLQGRNGSVVNQTLNDAEEEDGECYIIEDPLVQEFKALLDMDLHLILSTKISTLDASPNFSEQVRLIRSEVKMLAASANFIQAKLLKKFLDLWDNYLSIYESAGGCNTLEEFKHFNLESLEWVWRARDALVATKSEQSIWKNSKLKEKYEALKEAMTNGGGNETTGC